MQVYVTQGEHPTVPGRVLSVHSTREKAKAQELVLLKVMVNDTVELTEDDGDEAFAPIGTDESNESILKRLQKHHGEDECDVWTITCTVDWEDVLDELDDERGLGV